MQGNAERIREQFINRIQHPMHSLTKGDIERCISLWEEANKKFLTAIFPMRWGRIFTEGKPRSIYQLKRLVTSWGNFNRHEELSADDIMSIAGIIQQRNANKSHSSRNLSGNSSTLFRALAVCPSIAIHIKDHFIHILPNEIAVLCESLKEQIHGKYRSALNDQQLANADDLFQRLKILHHEKKQAAQELAKGNTYQGSLRVYLYLITNRIPTEEQAREIIEGILNKFVASARICQHNEFTFIEFLKQCGTRNGPCLNGSIEPSFVYAESIKIKAPDSGNQVSAFDESLVIRPKEKKFTDKFEVISFLFGELELNDSMSLEELKRRILARYANRQLGDFVITEDFLDKPLRQVLDLPEGNTARVM